MDPRPLRRVVRHVVGVLLRSSTLLAVGIFLAAGCGSNEPSPPPFPTDPAGHVFDAARVIEVDIEMAPADWDALRNQHRTWLDFAAAPNRRCLAQPIAKVFTDFPATVTVDGVRRDRVGVRKKGFIGSLDFEKPALRLKFDEYVADQTLHGLNRLTLSNAKQDPSYVKQCLAFSVFAEGGIPTPRCNFAHVTINGRDMGAYVNIEAIDKDFLRRHFENENGDLWEGLFSDFRRDWTLSFEKKTNESDEPENRGALDEVAAAVADTTPDGQVLEKLEKVFDVDRFLTFWATEVAMRHWDGYSNQANNFFVYRNPKDGRFVMIPWGLDQMTVQDPYQEPLPPDSVYARSILSRRLYRIPDTQALYLARLRRVLDLQWQEEKLLAEVERARALVIPVLSRAGEDLVEVEEALEGLRNFIRTRRGVVLADLARGPHVWDRPLREEPCVDLVGTLEGSFGTTFGTQGRSAYASGSSSLSGRLQARQLATRYGGATAGWDTNPSSNPPWPVVYLQAGGTDGIDYHLWIGVDPQYFVSGSTVSLDQGDAWGWLAQWNPATRTWTDLGNVANGRVRLDEAGLVDAGAVSGSITGWIVRW
jgi:hypothetical protein